MSNINKATFVAAIRIVHDAYYKLYKPQSEDEYIVLRNLIEGYLALLTHFDKPVFEQLRTYLIEHDVFNEKEIEALYDYYNDEVNITN